MSEILDWCITHPTVDVGFEFLGNMFIVRMTDHSTNNRVCKTLPLMRILARSYGDEELEQTLADMFTQLVHE